MSVAACPLIGQVYDGRLVILVFAFRLGVQLWSGPGLGAVHPGVVGVFPAAGRFGSSATGPAPDTHLH